MKVVLSTGARSDLKRHYRFGKQRWGSTRSQAFIRELRTHVAVLAAHPEVGVARSEVAEGIRCLIHREHLIFYRIDNAARAVVVLRILQGHENAEGIDLETESGSAG